MTIIDCTHTQSACYQEARPISPVGIVIHSTGADNPNLRRYCQPSKNDARRDELLKVIGTNKNGNSWNRSVNKSTHFMIGKLSDGSIGTLRLIPETMACWGVGAGKKGSYNYDPHAYLQFEVCEDDLKDKAYGLECYKEAVSLCAELCRKYGWRSSVILSHKEVYQKGYGSNHKDIDHWFKKLGLTMDDFRRSVDEVLDIDKPVRTILIGDTVLFSGSKHYTNSKKGYGKTCKPGLAEVLNIKKGAAHPYLIKAIKGSVSTAYGWVNEADISFI